LNFPALAAGSISPDVGYVFGETGISDLSHTLVGGLPFGLVVGLLLLACYYAVGPLVARRLPAPLREVLLPIFSAPRAAALIVVVSICIGVATHLLLDSFTHSQGWLVLHFQFLQAPVMPLSGRYVKVCHVIWYALSFAGIAWLVVAFRKWQTRQSIGPTPGEARTYWLEAVLIATLVLPVEVAHHLIHSKLGLLLVAGFSLTLVLMILGRSLRIR
jgi:hypothetical protein